MAKQKPRKPTLTLVCHDEQHRADITARFLASGHKSLSSYLIAAEQQVPIPGGASAIGKLILPTAALARAVVALNRKVADHSDEHLRDCLELILYRVEQLQEALLRKLDDSENL